MQCSQVWDWSQRDSKKLGISISLKFLRHLLPTTGNTELHTSTMDFCGTSRKKSWQVWSAISTWGSSHPSSDIPFQLPHPFAWAMEQRQFHSHHLYEIELATSLLILCPAHLQSLFWISIKNNNAVRSASQGPLLTCPHLFQTSLVFLSFTSTIILCSHLFLPLFGWLQAHLYCWDLQNNSVNPYTADLTQL